MIQQVQNSCQFHGLPSDDANKHLDKFLHVTQSIKVNGVTDDALLLYLFPHSLTHHATAWFDRLPRNLIKTFEQMAKMFLGKYFPPSIVTKLRNEITNIRQHLDESLFKAWERYKLSIDRCPSHNMLLVTLIDTFYNGLTLRHRHIINAAAGGTFMKRSTVGNTHNVYARGAYQAYQAPAYQAPVYQDPVHQPQIPQPQVVTTNEFTNFMKANDVILKNMQTNMTSLTNSNFKLKNMFGQFMKMNTASSSGSGTLPGNTITSPKEYLKGITTQSGTAYQGPTIPTTTTTSSSSVVECETEATKDMVHPTKMKAPKTAPKPNPRPSIPYPSRLHDQKLRDKANDQREKFFQIFKDLNFHISFADALLLMPKFSPTIKSLLTNKDKLYFDADPRVPLILERSFLKTRRALIDLFEGKLTLRVGKEAITFNLDQTSRYSTNYNKMTTNRIDVIDMACEEYSQEVLSFSDVIVSGNPTPYYDPIISTTSLTLTPFDDSDFFLKEFDAFLALEDDPTSPKIDQSYDNTEGDILLLEAFLNDDPSLPPPNQGNYLPQVRKELKICEAKTNKSSIDEPLEVELKDLPPHLEYVFLEGDDKLLVIIAKDLSVEEKTALITVMKSHKRAIAWKLSDIKGIDPEFCTQKILIEEDFEPAVQHQQRVNPKIHDVIKNEVLKLLDAGLIYPISDSPWVSPVHCVPKKGGFTVVENEDNELILTRLVTATAGHHRRPKATTAAAEKLFRQAFSANPKNTPRLQIYKIHHPTLHYAPPPTTIAFSPPRRYYRHRDIPTIESTIQHHHLHTTATSWQPPAPLSPSTAGPLPPQHHRRHLIIATHHSPHPTVTNKPTTSSPPLLTTPRARLVLLTHPKGAFVCIPDLGCVCLSLSQAPTRVRWFAPPP
nr:reverse transcriptase domain-containing protein [Tanacetum cinerariifolium]